MEDADSGGDIISPCKCSGSCGFVHKRCLEKWLSTAPPGIERCEICNSEFTFALAKRPKRFSQWVCARPFSEDHRNLVGDVVCFLLLTPLAVVSAYLCGVGSTYYYSGKGSEAFGLVFLASFLIAIYLVWLFLTVKFHVKAWMHWRRTNHDVELVDVNGEAPKTDAADRSPA